MSCLDWKTGQPNAKYWAIHMLAKEMGIGRKSLFNASVSVAAGGGSAPPPPPAGGGCFMKPKGAVNYKFAPGNVFPTDNDHPHGLDLANGEGSAILCWRSLSIHIETPARGRAGCGRLADCHISPALPHRLCRTACLQGERGGAAEFDRALAAGCRQA